MTEPQSPVKNAQTEGLSFYRLAVSACVNYEGEAGRRPIEDFLADASERLRPGLLRELVGVDIELRRARGETPVPDDYRARFPGHEDIVAAAFEASTALTEPVRAGATYTRADAPSAGPRFHALRLHAKGGFGEVHLAWDEQLQREVALKRIKGNHAFDQASRVRFEFEAKVTGHLEHPGVVPVHALERAEDGRLFYVMKFIRGESLRDAVTARYQAGSALSRLELRQFLSRFVTVCDTIAYAHSQGVLHRDLKPDNVMLGPFGETLVVDWGLAKQTGVLAQGVDEAGLVLPFDDAPGEAGHTEPGSVVGTPAYMSPEQASGRHDLQGPATDVYGLGAVLYYLLTGQSAIQDNDRCAVFARVVAGDFPHPRKIRPSAPCALEAICLKAMAREPANRYPSARALGEDVERWLADEPVSAYREPLLARLGRATRRHRPWVVSAAALGLVLTVVGLWMAKRDIDNRNERALQGAGRRAAEELERTQAYHALINRVRASRSEPRLGWSWRNLQDLKAAAAIETPARDLVEIHSEAAQCLAATDVRLLAELDHGLNTGRLAFSPDNKWLAAAEFKAQGYVIGHVKLIDVATGTVQREMTYDGEKVLARLLAKKRSQERVCDLAFSPDGRWLAAGMGSGRVFLWRADLPEIPPCVWYAHTSALARLHFGADSRSLWTGSGDDKSVKLWRNDGERWSSDQPALTLPTAGGVSDLALGSDTLWVADRGRNATLAFDAMTFAPTGEIAGLGERLVLSPDGRILAGGAGVEIKLASTARGAVYRSFKDPALAPEFVATQTELQFHPKGGWLASCVELESGRVNLWDMASGRLAATIPWSSKGRGSCTVSPDGRLIAVTGIKKTLLYEVRTPNVSWTEAHAIGRMFDVAWTGPDTFACVDVEGESRLLSLWNAVTGRNLGMAAVRPKPVGHIHRVRIAAHSSGSVALLASGETYLFANGLTGAPERVAALFQGDLAFTPDGKSLWGTSSEEWVDTWSIADKRLTRFWKDEADFFSGRSGMNGLAVGRRWVVAAGANGYVKVVDTRPGASNRVAMWGNGSEPFVGVALDPTETVVASGSQLGHVRIQRLPAGHDVTLIDSAHRDAVEALDFAPDGRVLVTGSLDGSIRLWVPGPDGRWTESLTLATTLGPVQRIRFSPDGRLLAVVVRNESAVHVWDFAALNSHLSALVLGTNSAPESVAGSVAQRPR